MGRGTQIDGDGRSGERQNVRRGARPGDRNGSRGQGRRRSRRPEGSALTPAGNPRLRIEAAQRRGALGLVDQIIVRARSLAPGRAAHARSPGPE